MKLRDRLPLHLLQLQGHDIDLAPSSHVHHEHFPQLRHSWRIKIN